MSYPAAPPDSDLDSVQFYRLEDEDAEEAKQQQQPQQPNSASNPYSYPFDAKNGPPPYQSSYVNALHGIAPPSHHLPSSIFRAPIVPFPAPTSPFEFSAHRRYHPQRNPYAYRGNLSDQYSQLSLDSDEEAELAERDELAQRVLAELDADAHPDPRIEFDPNPERGGKFHPLPGSPHSTSIAPTTPPFARVQYTAPLAANMAAASKTRHVAASPGRSAAPQVASPYPNASHSMHMSTESKSPLGITPSFTPAKHVSPPQSVFGLSAVPNPATTATASQTPRPIPNSNPSPDSRDSSLSNGTHPPINMADGVPSFTPGYLPQTLPVGVPYQTHLFRQRDQLDRIWKFEEQMELINRRRILSAQLFEQEHYNHLTLLEKQLAMKQMESLEQQEAIKRQEMRSRAQEALARDIDAAAGYAANAGDIPQAAVPTNEYVTPDSVNDSGDVSSYRPGLSMEALSSPAPRPVSFSTWQGSPPPMGAADAPSTPLINRHNYSESNILHTGMKASLVGLNHSVASDPVRERSAMPHGSPNFSLLSSSYSTPSSGSNTSDPGQPSASPPLVRLKQSTSGSVPTSAGHKSGDVDVEDLDKYRTYILGTNPTTREANEQAALRSQEAARGVDVLSSSLSSQYRQQLASTLATALTPYQKAVQTRAPVSSPPPVSVPVPTMSRAPDESHLPLALRSSRPKPLSSQPSTSRKIFGSTLRTTPPDSPRDGSASHRLSSRSMGADGEMLALLPPRSNSSASTARSNTNESIHELDTDLHRMSATGRNGFATHRSTASTASAQGNELTLSTHRSQPDGVTSLMAVNRMPPPSFLSSHSALLYGLAREEQHWDQRLQTKRELDAYRSEERRIEEAVEVRRAREEREQQSTDLANQIKSRIIQTSQSQSTEMEALLSIAAKRSQLKGEKLAHETKMLRKEMQMQSNLDALHHNALQVEFDRKRRQVQDAAVLSERASLDLKKTLVLQQGIRDRFLAFESEIKAKQMEENQKRNALVRQLQRSKEDEEKKRQDLWHQAKWSEREKKEDSGNGIEKARSTSSMNASATSETGRSEDDEWEALKNRVTNMLPSDAVAALPPVTAVPPDEQLDTARSTSSNVSSSAPLDPDHPLQTFRDKANRAQHVDHFMKKGTLPAGVSGGEFIPQFYQHLKSELEDLTSLRNDLDSQARTLALERLAMAEADQQRIEELIKTKTETRERIALEDAKRAREVEEEARRLEAERNSLFQLSAKRIRDSSRDRQEKARMERLREEALTREEVAKRASWDEEGRFRRQSLSEIEKVKEAEWEAEAKRKLEQLQQLDAELEERKRALADVKVVGVRAASSTSSSISSGVTSSTFKRGRSRPQSPAARSASSRPLSPAIQRLNSRGSKSPSRRKSSFPSSTTEPRSSTEGEGDDEEEESEEEVAKRMQSELEEATKKKLEDAERAHTLTLAEELQRKLQIEEEHRVEAARVVAMQQSMAASAAVDLQLQAADHAGELDRQKRIHAVQKEAVETNASLKQAEKLADLESMQYQLALQRSEKELNKDHPQGSPSGSPRTPITPQRHISPSPSRLSPANKMAIQPMIDIVDPEAAAERLRIAKLEEEAAAQKLAQHRANEATRIEEGRKQAEVERVATQAREASNTIAQQKDALKVVSVSLTSAAKAPTAERPPSPLNSSVLNSSIESLMGTSGSGGDAPPKKMSLADRFEARVRAEKEQKEREIEARRKDTIARTIVSPPKPATERSLTATAAAAKSEPVKPDEKPLVSVTTSSKTFSSASGPVRAPSPRARAPSPILTSAQPVRPASPAARSRPSSPVPSVPATSASIAPVVASPKSSLLQKKPKKNLQKLIQGNNEDEDEESTGDFSLSLTTDALLDLGKKPAGKSSLTATSPVSAKLNDSNEFDFDSLMDASIHEVVTQRKPTSAVASTTTAPAVSSVPGIDDKPVAAESDDDDGDDLSISLSISTVGEEKIAKAKESAKLASVDSTVEANSAAVKPVVAGEDLIDSLLNAEKDDTLSYELSFDDASYHEFMEAIKDPENAQPVANIKAKLSVKRDANTSNTSLNTSSTKVNKSGLGLEIAGRPVSVVVTSQAVKPVTPVAAMSLTSSKPTASSDAASSSSTSSSSSASSSSVPVKKGNVSSLASAFTASASSTGSSTYPTSTTQKRTSSVKAAISNFNKEIDDAEEESLFGGFGRPKPKKGAPPPIRTDLVPVAAPIVLRDYAAEEKQKQAALQQAQKEAEEAAQREIERLASEDPDFEPPPSAATLAVLLRRDNPRQSIREGLVHDMLLQLEVKDKSTGIKKGTVKFGVQMLLDANILAGHQKRAAAAAGGKSAASSSQKPGKLADSASHASIASALSKIHDPRG